jgi:hypothetical protein
LNAQAKEKDDFGAALRDRLFPVESTRAAGIRPQRLDHPRSRGLSAADELLRGDELDGIRKMSDGGDDTIKLLDVPAVPRGGVAGWRRFVGWMSLFAFIKPNRP